MIIQISGEYGEPKADEFLWPMQKRLNDCFKKNMSGTYFNSLKEMSIVFRVSGKVRDFESEGPERMKYLKKEPSITIDLVFPTTAWKGVEKAILKGEVAENVRNCIHLMLDKAASLGEVRNADSFNQDFERSIREFLDG